MPKLQATNFNSHKRDKKIVAIAKEHLSIETLACRNSDSLDFHDVSVWSAQAALEAAYRAGEASERKRNQT